MYCSLTSRVHAVRPATQVWAYGDATPAIVQVLQLRESLRPYVERAMVAANATGVPALRPMWLEHPQDSAVWWAEGQAATDDAELWAGQFMLGPDYLVSPVTQYGATAWPVRALFPLIDRYICIPCSHHQPVWTHPTAGVESAAMGLAQVYLPSGHRWRSHASGEEFDGGVAVVVNVTELTAFPLFLRLPDAALGSTADERLRART